jgi:hypothetical protein
MFGIHGMVEERDREFEQSVAASGESGEGRLVGIGEDL